MKNNYDINKWAEQTSVGKKIFVLGFHFNGTEIPGMKLVETSHSQEIENFVLTEYYWQGIDDPDVTVKIDVMEAADWQGAQQLLLHDLQNRMGFNLPEASSKDIHVGDIAYTSFHEIPNGIIFSRSNLVIKLNSIGKKMIAVDKVAITVDQMFVNEPQMKAMNAVVPTINNFSLSDDTTTLDKPVKINVDGSDQVGGKVWYRLHAENGHFKREGKQVTFIPDRKGDHNLTVHAFNKFGASEQGAEQVLIG